MSTYEHLTPADCRRYVLERARELEWAHWQTTVRLAEAEADPAADGDVVQALGRDLDSVQARLDVVTSLLGDLAERDDDGDLLDQFCDRNHGEQR